MRQKSKPLILFIKIGAILILLLWIIIPLYWVLVTSLHLGQDTFSIPPKLFPAHPQWGNYLSAVKEKPVLNWIGNSLIVSIMTSVFSLFISIYAAYGLSRFNFKGRHFIGFAILFTQMLPGTLFIIPMYLVFKHFQLLDSLLGLIIAYTSFGIPLCTWMLKSYFDSIPVEIEEAAYIDGCSFSMTLYRIILPISKPGLAATGIYSLILGWNEFMFARTFINSQARWPITVGLSSFTSEYSVEWNVLMAAAVMCSIPILLIYLVLQRSFIQGMTSGAIKG